jgi:transcriptional regulator with XRE-family HTH domain
MVKILREQRGWDIFELARASQLRVRELARIEGQLTRGRELRPRTFERLALAFGSESEPAELILRYCPQRPHDSPWQPLIERWQRWFGRQFVPLAVEVSTQGESGTPWHISCEVQGVSLEVRWPAGHRTQAELAIILSPELGIDPNRLVDIGLKASRGLRGESWDEWVRRGAWHDEVLVRGVLTVPLTRPGVPLSERQKARLRRWLEEELLLNPPYQFA